MPKRPPAPWPGTSAPASAIGPGPCPRGIEPQRHRGIEEYQEGIMTMKHNQWISLLFSSLCLCASVVSPSAARASSDRPEYNRDVRPILAENCFNCHGPDSASRKA